MFSADCSRRMLQLVVALLKKKKRKQGLASRCYTWFSIADLYFLEESSLSRGWAGAGNADGSELSLHLWLQNGKFWGLKFRDKNPHHSSLVQHKYCRLESSQIIWRRCLSSVSILLLGIGLQGSTLSHCASELLLRSSIIYTPPDEAET